MNDIRPGDRVMLRGSDPPRTGTVEDRQIHDADFALARNPDPGAPANMAWIRWDRTAERLADLIKLTEGE